MAVNIHVVIVAVISVYLSQLIQAQTSCSPNSCAAGFTCSVIPNGHKCLDINECALGIHNCHLRATCENTQGSFICTCKSGFTGNGVTCTDINECAVRRRKCPPGKVCKNTIGSFKCVNEAPPSLCPSLHGLFPHPTNCHKFIHCAHGRPNVKSCAPRNLVFNPIIKSCDWPQNYPCSNPRFCVGKVNGLYPHGNCHHFYQCDNQRTHVKSCPAALYYNPATKQCDWPKNVVISHCVKSG